MKTIFIFGANGYFGQHFVKFFTDQNWAVFTDRVDICDLEAVKNVLHQYKPAVVLNCAGKTGVPNVDWCETHQAETMAVNVQGALNIACACFEDNLYLVHIGSGCVYSGDNNYHGFSETDEPNFTGSFYSRTKALSEKALQEFNPLQLRVRIPLEGKPNNKNVINKLLKYSKVASINNSFTIVEDFLTASYGLIINRHRGIFNMTNVGYMNHEFLMEKYRAIVDNSRQFTYMTEDELNQITIAKRSNCVLNTNKRESLGFSMPDIKSRVDDILHSYAKNLLN